MKIFLYFCSSLLTLAVAADFNAVASDRRETAYFASGCFWGGEEFFRKIPGVMETEVGYAGGKAGNPTYDEVSEGETGHAETVKVVFDPGRVTYQELLDKFFKMHDPTTKNRQGNDVGSQYRSAIFYSSEEHRMAAESFKRKVEASGAWRRKITTEIAPAKKFYPAEEYHQKYLVKHPGGYDNHYLRELSFD